MVVWFNFDISCRIVWRVPLQRQRQRQLIILHGPSEFLFYFLIMEIGESTDLIRVQHLWIDLIRVQNLDTRVLKLTFN